MSGFLALLLFDLRCASRRISTWIYIVVFAALGVLMTAMLGDAFTAVGSGLTKANAPSTVIAAAHMIGVMATVTIGAVMGQAVHRDIATGIHPLIFTAPLSKAAYLGARFFAAFLVSAGILAAIPLGLLAGTVLPAIPADRLGPFRYDTYLWAYGWLLSNLLWIGAVFFAIAAATRTMRSNYLGAVILLVGYLVSQPLLGDLEHRKLAALIDPFGGAAMGVVTDHWTSVERNTQLVPLSGVLLVNRMLWAACGIAVALLCAWRFRQAHAASERPGRAARSVSAALPPPASTPPPAICAMGWTVSVRQCLATVRLSCRTIVADIYFPIIVLVGMVFLAVSARFAGRIYGTPTWPVTYQVLEALQGGFPLFILIIIALYAGELVWQERDKRLHHINDAMPVPTWSMLVGKLGGLMLIVLLLQSVVLLVGVIIQLVHGFYDIRIDHYLIVLYGMDLLYWLPVAAFAIAVHVLVNQKYLAHFVFALVLVAVSYLPDLGFEHPLYRIGYAPDVIYSDLNGFGPFLYPWACFRGYWLAATAVLLLALVVLWVRGHDTAWRARLHLARQRLSAPIRQLGVASGLLMLGFGGWIFWNTNVLDTYQTEYDQQAQTVAYEREYKKYEHLPQPRIASLDVACDIAPQVGRARFAGTYQLVNRTTETITSLHVMLPLIAEVAGLSFTPTARQTHDDADQGYRIFTLDTPLPPGGTLVCDFDLIYQSRGFQVFSSVTGNGTFLHSGMLPSFGYNPDRELPDTEQRRKFGLGPRPRMAQVEDERARQNTYIARDADWIDFAATITTDADQIALAPGNLERTWTEKGRRHVRYRSRQPMLKFAAFLSARYASHKASWNDVAIEILYDPKHPYNIERMVGGVQQTLAYASAAFGPYPHDHLRIVEFPRYGTFAQSFPGLIPFSESIGFIARLDDETDIDYPFLVTAHEVAHQWWAHQVIGGNVQGSTVLSEALSQYTALMVMEQEYGPTKMRRFLKHELDSYLRGRSGERFAELPLARVENQQYLHYHKGALAMYALKELLGEDRLNGALRTFVAAKRYQSPPYTTSLELIDTIKDASPIDLHPAIDDLFLHITLWDLTATAATAEALPDGTWKVIVCWTAQKLRVDGEGKETQAPLDQAIELGVFAVDSVSGDDDGVPLVVEKRALTSGAGMATFIVNQKPNRAGIDPFNKFIDRKSDDNTIAVTIKTVP